MRRLLHLVTACACGAAALSCTRESPSTLPEPPDAAAPAPPPPELSRFSVPLEYDFTAVLKLVEKAVPTTFGSMDSVRTVGDDDHRHYAFSAKRAPFTAFADGNLLHLRTTLAYKARGFYKPPIGPTVSAGCGEGDVSPRLVLELATPLSLTPDWHLTSRAAVVRVEPASTQPRDRCEVSVLHWDVTDKVVGAARSALTDHLEDIDDRVAQVDLTSQATGWWHTLAQPIRLANDVWLLIGPEKLRMGRVRGRSRVLTVPVSLDARPRVVTSPKEPEVKESALPPLGKDSAATDFRIVIDGVIDYGTASRAITEAASERTLEKSGHTVKVTAVRVSPKTGGKLSLQVDFNGDASGTLELAGSPRYDGAAGMLSVPDLDFTLETNSALLRTYGWLKSDKLRGELRERAHVPVAPALARGRALLLEGLNRTIGDALTLTASVDSVGVRSLHVTRDGIVVRGEATGRARIAVRQR